MFDFLRRSKESHVHKSGSSNHSQKMLDRFYSNDQEKKRPMIQTVSVSRFESEVNVKLKSFQSYVELIKETSIRIEELRKIHKSGEITENAYNLIIDELGNQLSLAVAEIFKSREVLELDKAKAKLEWAKEKIGFRETEMQRSLTRNTHWGDTNLEKNAYRESSKWEEIISKIDATLSSLTIEEEASTIEQYLSSIKERSSQLTEETEGTVGICRQRHHLISQKWSFIRHDKIEQIINHELEATKQKDEIKELKVRFAVGELAQDTYESRTGIAQGSLKRIERTIIEIRNYIDDMDRKMFICLELLR